MSQAVTAAFHTLPPPSSSSGPDFHLFSVQGSYLGPASTDVPTTFTVQEIRTTRSMVTRLVTASQVIPPKAGSSSAPAARKVLICLLDFHRPEPAFLTYSRPPLHPGSYASPSTSKPIEEVLDSLPWDPKVYPVFKKQFELPLRMFEYRPVISSSGAQTSLGFVKVKTAQDNMEITRRTACNWIRARGELSSYDERCAALA